ncbi:MAG: sulfatase [Planctomycetota bacterium]
MRAAPLDLSSLLVCLAAMASCANDASEAPRVPPSVILVSIDTVRADSLSCYGGPEGATPALDALAGVATRYETCVSSAPWTMPSHASMFTGLYPFEHGAHTFGRDDASRRDNVFALHPKIETLAEALAAEGYRTGGVVANTIYLRPELGMDAGFQHWDVLREDGDRVTDRALAWLDETAGGDRPAFLFVNYMDAHRPYATGRSDVHGGDLLNALIERVMVEGEQGGALAEEVRALQQEAVTRLDGHLATLFDGLRERGLFEDAVIVVTSDHGEAFGEHGVVEHSKDVYEELVRVPLLVKRPGSERGDVRIERASSVDVAGLIAEALAETTAAGVAERFPRLPGAHPVLTENHFSRAKDLRRFGDRFQRIRRAVYEGEWKLIVDSRGSVELYDLASDAGERSDRASEEPDRAAAMESLLQATIDATVFQGERVLPGRLSRAQRDEMQTLGYGR